MTAKSIVCLNEDTIWVKMGWKKTANNREKQNKNGETRVSLPVRFSLPVGLFSVFFNSLQYVI